MPQFKVHCRECQQKLGYSYPYVHKFLDQYAPQYHFSKRHRERLHNERGIRLVEKKWGKGAKKAAILHIEADKRQDAYDIVKNMSMRSPFKSFKLKTKQW